jgi:hypothetical protein
MAAFVASLGSAAVSAETCPAMAGGPDSLAAIDAAARLAFLEASLAREAHRARQWNWSWGVGFAAAAAGQFGVAAALDDPDQQKGLYVGGTKAVLGVGAKLVKPLRVPRPAGGVGCAAVADAEARLLGATLAEARGRHWLRHVEVVGLNLVGVLVLGLGYDVWQEGLLGAAAGVVVGEIHIFTQPFAAGATLARYRRGAIAGAPPLLAPAWGLSPWVSEGGGGLVLSIVD